jgi:hypothetical protein
MTTTKTISLAEIARELHIDPKVARAKARRRSDELPKTVSDESWTFDAKLKSKLVAFLTNGQAKKAKAETVEIEKENFRRLKPDLKQALRDSVKLEAAKSMPVERKSKRKPS